MCVRFVFPHHKMNYISENNYVVVVLVSVPSNSQQCHIESTPSTIQPIPFARTCYITRQWYNSKVLWKFLIINHNESDLHYQGIEPGVTGHFSIFTFQSIVPPLPSFSPHPNLFFILCIFYILRSMFPHMTPVLDSLGISEKKIKFHVIFVHCWNLFMYRNM